MSELNKVSVIGAGGKMGAGITLLMLLLMQEGSLHAIDISEEALIGLRSYLKQQLTRYAEKNINKLRKHFAKDSELVSNEEMIEAFVWNALGRIQFSTHLEDTEGSTLIFEAAIEDIDAKVAIFKKIREINGDRAWILTNTSSIPIALLNDRAGLNHRIAGFHFYNPPAIQKLVEVIEPGGTPSELKSQIKKLGSALKKTLVYSNDVPGFIGNGYFMREILYTFHLWDKLGKTDLAFQQIETVTKDFLLRPMGIFQLIDYVGLDVVKNILAIMRLPTQEIEMWLDLGIKGGQTFEGQQKDGIFQYEHGKPKAFFSLQSKTYVPLENDLKLGNPPQNLSWKSLNNDPKKEEIIEHYLSALAKENTLGAKLALEYLQEGKKIANELVKNRVAHSLEDVATVLKNGFYHLYEKF